MAATRSDNRNRWTKDEEETVAKCIALSDSKGEAWERASEKLGRSVTAVRFHYYKSKSNGQKNKKFIDNMAEYYQHELHRGYDSEDEQQPSSEDATVKEVTKTDEAINITMETDTGTQISISIK